MENLEGKKSAGGESPDLVMEGNFDTGAALYTIKRLSVEDREEEVDPRVHRLFTPRQCLKCFYWPGNSRGRDKLEKLARLNLEADLERIRALEGVLAEIERNPDWGVQDVKAYIEGICFKANCEMEGMDNGSFQC